MKKLLFVFVLLCFAIGIFVHPVFATFQDQCNQEFTYGWNNADVNVDDNRVEINVHSSDNNQTITVQAQSGYQVIDLDLDGDNSGNGTDFDGGNRDHFNPSGIGTIARYRVVVKKVCPTPTPTPSPTPTPTVDPTPTPEPECEEGYHEDVVSEEKVCVPDTTPTPTPTPSDPPVGGKGEPGEAPVCPAGNTVNLPGNPHVLRNGEEATVNFFITEGDHANIYYKEVGEDHWTHSVLRDEVKKYTNSDKFVSYPVGDLVPNLGYTFGIQQVQGCGGGQLVTAVIIDDPTPTLFRLSYWTW